MQTKNRKKINLGVCNCSMFCCTLLYVHSSIAIILMGKRELVALLSLSSWCLAMVERLFLPLPWGCLRFVIVVYPDHTHLLFFIRFSFKMYYIMLRFFNRSPKGIYKSCMGQCTEFWYLLHQQAASAQTSTWAELQKSSLLAIHKVWM